MPCAVKQQEELRNAAAAAAQHHPWWRKALLAYLAVPLAVLALEGVLSCAGLGQGEIVKPDQELGCVHIPNKFITWRLEGYSRGRLNSVGMRDVEHAFNAAPGLKRIAFVGDSYTEGLQVPMDKTFARLSAGLTGCETLNFGCSSYSTGQELMLYNKQVRAYKPDIVVLFYTPGDTVENTISLEKRFKAEPRPYFYLDEKQRLMQDNGVLTLNAEKLKDRPLREFLRANSTIFGAFHQSIFSLALSDKVYLRTVRLADRLIQSITNLGLKRGLKPGQTPGKKADQPLLPPPGLFPPRWQDSDPLEVSQVLVSKFSDDVKASGAKFVVMTYPDYGKNDKTFALARARFAKLAKEKGFAFLDLSEVFNQHHNYDKLFVKVHFSSTGHDLTARALSEFLKDRGLLTD